MTVTSWIGGCVLACGVLLAGCGPMVPPRDASEAEGRACSYVRGMGFDMTNVLGTSRAADGSWLVRVKGGRPTGNGGYSDMEVVTVRIDGATGQASRR